MPRSPATDDAANQRSLKLATFVGPASASYRIREMQEVLETEADFRFDAHFTKKVDRKSGTLHFSRLPNSLRTMQPRGAA
jgi:hypothetical protein